MMTTYIQSLSVKLKTISLEMSIHSHILARNLLIMSLILLYVNYSQENSLRLIAFINMKTFSRTTLSHLSPGERSLTHFSEANFSTPARPQVSNRVIAESNMLHL